jgi:hypothetical protein
MDIRAIDKFNTLESFHARELPVEHEIAALERECPKPIVRWCETLDELIKHGVAVPPSTRSSSATPVGIRSASAVSTSTRRRRGRPAAGEPRTPGAGASARSSTKLPHDSQPGQRPSHFPVVYPHSEHACWTAAFAMGSPV